MFRALTLRTLGVASFAFRPFSLRRMQINWSVESAYHVGRSGETKSAIRSYSEHPYYPSCRSDSPSAYSHIYNGSNCRWTKQSGHSFTQVWMTGNPSNTQGALFFEDFTLRQMSGREKRAWLRPWVPRGGRARSRTLTQTHTYGDGHLRLL